MVHYRSIQAEGYKTVREGQAVEFIETKSKKGLQAAEVIALETSAAAQLDRS